MRHSIHFWNPVALLLGGAMFAGTATAQQSPYYIGVAASYQHDDNFLRLANGATTAVGSKSDNITTGSLLAGFDQHLGRQRIYANAALRDSRYQRNPVYNNQGYTGTAGLDWSTVERISGSLSGTVNRGLASFYSTGGDALLERNIQDTQALNATVNVGMVTQYSLFGNFGHRQLKNSAAVVQNSDFDQDTGSLGVRWSPRAQTSLGLALTGSQGRYPKFRVDGAGGFVPDRFKQTGVELSGQLQPSGASTFDAKLGYSKTRYDLNESRDFSGVTGSLGFNWQPRAKLRTSLRLTRDTGQNAYAVTLFDPIFGFTDSTQLASQLVNLLRLQVDYDATAKISVTTSLQYVQRNIATTLQGVRAEGKDGSTLLQIGVRWSPLRSVSTGCDVGTENRTASGVGTAPIKDNTFSCYAQFQLQQ